MAHLSFVCLSHGGGSLAPVSQNHAQAGGRVSVGLPTPAKSQKMDRGTLSWCSLPKRAPSALSQVRLFHTSLSLGTFPHNSRLRRSLLDLPTCIIPRGLWLHLLRTMFSAPRAPDPSPSLLLDAAVQTPLYSVASHDASTHLPLTEFFVGCIFLQ